MAAIALGSCLAVAGFEFAAALVTTPAPDVRLVTAGRLILIDVTLVALFWLPLTAMLAATAVLPRLALTVASRNRAAAWSGLFAGLPADRDSAPGPQPGVARMWAVLLCIAIYIAGSTYATFRAVTFFKNLQVTALLLSVLQVASLFLLLGVGRVSTLVFGRVAALVHPRLGRFNPLGRTLPAVVAVGLFGMAAVGLLLVVLPEMAPLIPWRLILSAAVAAAGGYGAMIALARRGHVLPANRRRRRGVLAGAAVFVLAVMPLTLVRIGADHEAKSVAITGSPFLVKTIDLLRIVTDLDRDGYGFLLGENDCAPLDRAVHPLARDIPDNGIDEDCNGRDFSFRTPPQYKKGDRLPVPEPYRRDWNFLLLTVDTVRYDHTGFGGYIARRGRDTTPNLDKLVERSISFTFANAPSAGTMASIPAILTSKFFHSGVALDENVKPRMPPRLRPENVLISELLEQRGYKNGAIVSHYYFNDWGMEQGFDTYDNEVGRKNEPYKVTSHDITDKALAWVARNLNRKWFLWVHYIDPHGRYVAHPGERSFGKSEEDLYDGELYYTDKHIGRLIRELSKMPGMDRTVLFLTSDHGDGFKEHGFINHGMALYRELLHVPLIVTIPEVPPRQIPGAVSPIDIFPTMCELAGIDVADMNLEGESLVPQIFYGNDAHHRVVFAETNWPRPLRAAITSRYKLIYRLMDNVYEFYDLTADPWEKRNIYQTADKKELGQMKGYLDDWLERVYYSRDTLTNQAAAQRASFLLEQRPVPKLPAAGTSFDNGRIEVIGIDTDKPAYRAGEWIHVAVYLHATERPGGDFRLQLTAWLDAGDVGTPERPGARPPTAKPAGQPTASGPATGSSPGRPRPRNKTAHNQKGPRFTGDGLFPSSRWRSGEYIRDRFKIRVPASWTDQGTISLGLRMSSADRRTELVPSGVTRKGAPRIAVLGQVELLPRATPTSPAPGPTRKSSAQPGPPQPAARAPTRAAKTPRAPARQ
ncbi:MAG: sulfatase-like hydrolase/transferase [Proteobacteria bacterium]|nr:sulfatase-like hydrolase/transferase [Pseudomonadota bacterium]